jgi:hypothetical protein
MGLDFSHTDAHFSYYGFHEFRRRLALLIGVNLDEMKGFTDPPEAGKPWSAIDDPIVHLLDHSDCNGEIDREQCEEVARRLRQLLDEWQDEDDEAYAYYQLHGRKLVQGLEIASAFGHSLHFC